MGIDVSATKNRMSPYDPDFPFRDRPLGRYAPKAETALTDRQERTVREFLSLVPTERRQAFREAVLSRLGGGAVGGGAIKAAAVAAAVGFVARSVLAEHGLAEVASTRRDYAMRRSTNDAEDD
jgi:hypothetical protein